MARPAMSVESLLITTQLYGKSHLKGLSVGECPRSSLKVIGIVVVTM